MSRKDELKDSMKMRLGGGMAAPKAVDSIFLATTEPQAEKVEELASVNEAVEIKKKAKLAAKASKPEPMKNVMVPMPLDLKDAIEKLTKAIDRNSQKKQERITANSVIRGFLSLVKVYDIDVSGIDSEKSLKEAIFKALSTEEGER